MDEDVMSSVESLSLVQPFMAHFISKYFVIVNLQLYLAAAFTFSILFLYELFPTTRMSKFFYWLLKLMCFATILLIMKLYVCQVSYSYIIPDLFYYLDSSCLLESLHFWLLSLGYLDFGAIWWFNSLSLIYRSMKSRILATYPDAFPDDSTGEVVDRRPDLEIPQ